MSSAKGKFARLLGGFFLRSARVTAAEDVAPGFRRIALRGDAPPPLPGNKLQILLPSDDVRTYTPIASEDGTTLLLGWKHAGGPGARFVSEVEVGTQLRFVGPQRSLDLAAGPVIFVGDETSVAAAASFERSRPGQVHAVLCGQSPEALRAAAESVGLRPSHALPRGDIEGVVAAVLQGREAAPGATIALSGGSELILAVRAALRQRGITGIKTKTYWIPGKTGLD